MWGGNTSGSGSGSGTGSGYGTGTGTGTSGSGVYGGTADSPNTQNQPTRRNEIPAGQEIDARVERELSSDTAQVEERFTATTVVACAPPAKADTSAMMASSFI